jgi:hypothetical protein
VAAATNSSRASSSMIMPSGVGARRASRRSRS